MLINLTASELAAFYSRAKEAYRECITGDNTELLQEEMEGLFELEIINSDVKIVFHQENPDSYSFEITLNLWKQNKWVGKYVYVEEEDGNPDDDRLMFF